MDWNYTAVGDLLAFDHTLGDDTLTESPPYSVPLIQEARGDLTALTVSILKESITNPGRTVLSASGGFDSRLLLAALLHLGIRPRLMVCGPRGNFDRDVVEQMGKKLSLEVTAVELCAQDYVDHAERIVQVTGGTKAARHWHTFLYPPVPAEGGTRHGLQHRGGGQWRVDAVVLFSIEASSPTPRWSFRASRC